MALPWSSVTRKCFILSQKGEEEGWINAEEGEGGHEWRGGEGSEAGLIAIGDQNGSHFEDQNGQ